MDSLNEKERRFIEQIRAVKPGTYEPSFLDFVLIAKLSENNALDASFDYFLYGFLKGQRAAKAEAKRRAAK